MMNTRICLTLLVMPIIMACVAVPTSTPTQNAYQDLVVGVSHLSYSSPWLEAHNASIRETAEQLGITFRAEYYSCKQEIQISALRHFIAEDVDVIGISPVVETGWDTVFQEAKDAGIPIILFARPADVPDDLYVTYLASDFIEQGRKAGRVLAELMDGQGNIVELMGTPGSGAANDRGEGFYKALQDYPEMKVIASESGNFYRAEGKEAMADLLQQYGSEIDALYAHNDDMALGAIEAIEEYGLVPGADIKIVSIDATRGAFEAMIEGKLNATIECDPLIGPLFFELALKVANGEDVPKRVYVEEGIFFPEDAEDLLPTRKY